MRFMALGGKNEEGSVAGLGVGKGLRKEFVLPSAACTRVPLTASTRQGSLRTRKGAEDINQAGRKETDAVGFCVFSFEGWTWSSCDIL
jgi:hypothetical protein